VNRAGIKLAERMFGGNRFYLYDVDGFYVELLHNMSNLKAPGLVIYRVFDDISFLDIYLEKMDIDELTGTAN